MELVTIGCRLPNGIRLEVGFSTSQQGSGGTPFARFTKHADYEQVLIKGTNQNMVIREPDTRKIVGTFPSKRDAAPYLTQVSKAFWDRWTKSHPGSWLISSGQLFVVPKNDEKTVAAVTRDAIAISKPIFQPLNPLEIVKLESHDIATRTDDL